MTAKEVVEEFLKRKGVSTPREFFKNNFKGKQKPQSNSLQNDSNGKISSAGEKMIGVLERIGVEYNQCNGWKPFSNSQYGSKSETLYRRFGCRKTPQIIRMGDKK